MAKYVLLLNHRQSGTLHSDLLEQHVRHLRRLKQRGLLFLCGPLRDSDGAMQILETQTISQARELAESDPFIAQKYYASYTLHELVEANEENGYLLDSTQNQID